jgi:hypothetical protein
LWISLETRKSFLVLFFKKEVLFFFRKKEPKNFCESRGSAASAPGWGGPRHAGACLIRNMQPLPASRVDHVTARGPRAGNVGGQDFAAIIHSHP